MERGAYRLAVLLPHRQRRALAWAVESGAQMAVRNGFELMIPPVLVRPRSWAGTGFLGAHADEVYHLPDDDLYPVGTSDVPLAGYHSNEIIDLSDGPKRYAGWSSCFRREAGSYGGDTRGIIRVHQFDKVEGLPTADRRLQAEHLRLLGWEREMLDAIDVPYRVIDICRRRPGQLGCPQVRLRGGCPPADLPRVDLDVELHDLPGAPPLDPVTATRTEAADRRNSTARWRPPGGSSRSSRTTSSRMVPVVLPPALAASVGREVPRQAMSIRTLRLARRRTGVDRRGDGTLQPWVSLEDRGVPMRWSGLGGSISATTSAPSLQSCRGQSAAVLGKALSVLGLALSATGGQWQSAIRWFFGLAAPAAAVVVMLPSPWLSCRWCTATCSPTRRFAGVDDLVGGRDAGPS